MRALAEAGANVVGRRLGKEQGDYPCSTEVFACDARLDLHSCGRPDGSLPKSKVPYTLLLRSEKGSTLLLARMRAPLKEGIPASMVAREEG